MRTKAFIRGIALSSAFFAFALALSACGEDERGPVVQGFSPGYSLEFKTSPEGPDYPEVVSLDDALAELNALETPDGVDPTLFEELKDALESQLESRFSNRDSLPGHSRLESRDSRYGGKFVSTPPAGDANQVKDLAVTDNGDGTYTLSWHYRNLGDYDQDGEVGISDITPLAQHFGESTVPENEWIDGDLDGRVHISDITQIAMYFAAEVAEYAVEGAVSAEGEFTEIGEVDIADATGKDTGRAEFEYALTPGENGYFQVVPRDGDGMPSDASNIVGLALEVLRVSPLEVKEGTVVTFSAEVAGAGPIDYAWDFAGQAVPDTSTEASPEVVLTREVGEFSALLTVTNPQGDVTFPFTLTKLSREWKFETILSNPEGLPGGFCLQEYGGKLWFYAHDGGSPANKYLVSGLPGNWSFEEITASGFLDLDSQGRPGLVNVPGPFLDKTLTLWEKRGGEWETIELISCRVFSRISFVYAANDEPFITFSLPDAPNSRFIEYFWRRGGEWERGIVDEPGWPSHEGTAIAADPNGNPVLCYNAYKYNEFCEFRIAWWNADTAQWDILIVENHNIWDPAIDFDQAGRLCVAYSDFYEGEPDVQYERLIYAVYGGASWEKELVDERPSEGRQSYCAKSLAHDSLGNAVIAYTHKNPYDPDIGWDTDLVVQWFDGNSWQKYVLDEEGKTGEQPYAVVSENGTAYVLYRDYTGMEVIMARYE